MDKMSLSWITNPPRMTAVFSCMECEERIQNAVSL